MIVHLPRFELVWAYSEAFECSTAGALRTDGVPIRAPDRVCPTVSVDLVARKVDNNVAEDSEVVVRGEEMLKFLGVSFDERCVNEVLEEGVGDGGEEMGDCKPYCVLETRTGSVSLFMCDSSSFAVLTTS